MQVTRSDVSQGAMTGHSEASISAGTVLVLVCRECEVSNSWDNSEIQYHSHIGSLFLNYLKQCELASLVLLC